MEEPSLLINSIIIVSFLIGSITTIAVSFFIGKRNAHKSGGTVKTTAGGKRKAEKIIWEKNEEPYLIIDGKGMASSMNDAMKQLLGAEQKMDWQSRKFTSLVIAEEEEKVEQLIHNLMAGKAGNTEITLLQESNRPLHVNLTYVPFIQAGKIDAGLLSFRNCTDEKSLEKQLYHMAHYDALTDLPNRRLLEKQLEVVLQQMRQPDSRGKLAVMFVEIDNVQGVNHSLGHDFGDMLLITIGHRLQACVRENDMVARLDGNEFIILLPEIVTEEIMIIADRIIQAIEQPCIIKGHEIHITTYLGVSLYPDDGEDVQTLLRHADTAMFHAREGKGNQYRLFSSIMNDIDFERLYLEEELHRALEHDEFLLYYQPKICSNTQRIVGLEALIRWKHPVKGIIMPQEFIPLAEQTGFIVRISEWVLNKACEHAAKWQAQGYPPVRISINVSNRQFWKSNFVENVESTLKKTGLAPEYLELELTEKMLANHERSVQILQKLKKVGVQIAIDQFGSSQHVLSHLIQYPIDRYNIDRSFIYEIPYNHKNQAVVLSTIILAHHLGRSVLVKGIETKEELSYLLENNCDECQGYLFYEPVPDHQVKELLRQNVVLSNMV
ncbi:sensor domain-containing protein [Brevibacillus daliensis]|uniref:sensor domain-containing protein n=1 Tax=Brevibacillus daliensis TaxID=2892995 RepID=UPI001E50A322|nr:EAL domain-containing protein [Brevibacillus daliensis]